ncbi:phosphotransferase [uncultured Moraxella sp.]|uniref:aminoglycoside phosphotransferase family protein n=1 Tax=uncultured Moraxella sp. TaxID=263769 RepID=UPI0025F574C8|nr:phosphotransferase [uncultured Moraxella sp.]
MSSTRHDEMMNFLNANLAKGFEVESLPGDASFRRYHRIHLPVVAEEGKVQMTYLLMDAPPEKESVEQFVHVCDILSETVNVPDIIARDVPKGFLLLQDFGTTEFAHLIADDAEHKDGYYTKALQTLVQLQSIDTQVDLPTYSDVKLEQEMDLFDEWFLPYLDVKMSPNAKTLWQKLKQTLIDNINAQPQVIVHRDYHSRNLMADKGSDALGVIDFQDAVIGAYTYDLVSLVRDAYINYDEQWVEKRIHEFYKMIEPSVDLGSFIAQTNIMGIQRHLKVLGIFIRLSERDGKHRYLDNIPKVMQDLLTELTWLKDHHIDGVYQEFLVWLETFVLPSYQKKFQKQLQAAQS